LAKVRNNNELLAFFGVFFAFPHFFLSEMGCFFVVSGVDATDSEGVWPICRNIVYLSQRLGAKKMK
jgi:hypothetical protein